MNLTELSKASSVFSFNYVTNDNINDVLALEKGNALFYKLLCKPLPKLKECYDDLTALPPGKDLKDKLFTAVYKDKNLVALIDFISAYPDDETGFIGFFMIDSKLHHKETAKMLFEDLKKASRACNLNTLQLGCYETNTVGLAFWKKCGFVEIDRVNDDENNTIIKMSLKL